MSASGPLPDHVLADSRTTLRQVSDVVLDLEGMDPEEIRDQVPRALVEVLLRAYGEVHQVIQGLRQSRGTLNRAALRRLQSTNVRLQEVSSTTEVAATDMLDGLDRTVHLLDRWEALDERGDARDPEGLSGPELRQAMRDQLDALVSLLQFQDITSQQLGYASGVLTDVEHRLVSVARVLSLGGTVDGEVDDDGPEDNGDDAVASATCDPGASTDGADDRQALADEIFGAA